MSYINDVRKIHYVTGSRADFGLIKRTLLLLQENPSVELKVLITGQHTSLRHGLTSEEVILSGLNIGGLIPVELAGVAGGEMALAIASELEGLVNIWKQDPPDLVLLLGDRGEMLAAAIAAIHFNIHICHIHGGERSGTVDESIRHAVSKLSHFHITSSMLAKERLIRMGENPESVHVSGAPGLVGMPQYVRKNRRLLAEKYFKGASNLISILVFHPVVQDASKSLNELQLIVDVLTEKKINVILIRPNSDSGGNMLDNYIDNIQDEESFAVKRHLARDEYLDAIRHSDLMIGNSSSGIIECASLGTPVVNIGSRQLLRDTSENTITYTGEDKGDLGNIVDQAISLSPPFHNIYGDGTADTIIVGLLCKLELSKSALNKSMMY